MDVSMYSIAGHINEREGAARSKAAERSDMFRSRSNYGVGGGVRSCYAYIIRKNLRQSCHAVTATTLSTGTA
jgi:hypothetical protein